MDRYDVEHRTIERSCCEVLHRIVLIDNHAGGVVVDSREVVLPKGEDLSDDLRDAMAAELVLASFPRPPW